MSLPRGNSVATLRDQYLVVAGRRAVAKCCRETNVVAKRKDTRRTRTKARSNDGQRTIATTLSKDQLHLRRQRWRALKQQFDHAHHAGMLSLKRRDYHSLHAAIVHERRIIDELAELINEAKAQVRYTTPSSRR